jgi:hypothetical protein
MLEPASSCWEVFSRNQELASRWAFVDVGPITRWWNNPDECEVELAVLEFSLGPATRMAIYSARYTSDGWMVTPEGSDDAAEQGVEADEALRDWSFAA